MAVLWICVWLIHRFCNCCHCLFTIFHEVSRWLGYGVWHDCHCFFIHFTLYRFACDVMSWALTQMHFHVFTWLPLGIEVHKFQKFVWFQLGGLVYRYGHHCHCFSCFHLCPLGGLAVGHPLLPLTFHGFSWLALDTKVHKFPIVIQFLLGGLVYRYGHHCHCFSCFHLCPLGGLAMGHPLLPFTFQCFFMVGLGHQST